MKLKYVSLALLAPSILLAMEQIDQSGAVVKRESSQKLLGATGDAKSLQAPGQVVLTMEQDQPVHKELDLKVELIAALRSGRTSKYVALLAEPENVNRTESDIAQTRSADQIVSALALVNSSLATEESKKITSQLQALFPRYQYALPPAAVTLGLLANIGLTIGQFKILSDSTTYTVTALDKGQFAINIFASALGAFIAGLRTGKQVKKGWYDTRQDKAVENLKGAQLTLTLLQHAGLNPDGTIKAEYVALIQKQEQLIATLNLEVAQATVAAQEADADAAATEAALNKGTGKEEADGQATTRSLITRGGSVIIDTTNDTEGHNNNNQPAESAAATAAQEAPVAQEVAPTTQPETPVTRDETVVEQAQPAASASEVEAKAAVSTEVPVAGTQENPGHTAQEAQVADDATLEIVETPNPAYNPHEELAVNDTAVGAGRQNAEQALDAEHSTTSAIPLDDTLPDSAVSSNSAFTPSKTLNAKLDKIIAADALTSVQEQAQESAEVTAVAAQVETAATEVVKEASPVLERAKTPEVTTEAPAQVAPTIEDAHVASPAQERVKTPEATTEAPAQETSTIEDAHAASPVQERTKTPEVTAEIPAQEAVVEKQTDFSKLVEHLTEAEVDGHLAANNGDVSGQEASVEVQAPAQEEVAGAAEAQQEEALGNVDGQVASPVVERAQTPEAQADVPAQQVAAQQEEAKKNDPNEDLEPLDFNN